jgi:cellulose biosynthesis protein BcsQ
LPGSPHLYDFDGEITKSKGGANEIMLHTAFGNLMRMASYVTDTDYILVDLGPSSSYLNKVMLMSCDFILPSMFPDFFSLSSLHALLHALLHVVLPSVTSELQYA